MYQMVYVCGKTLHEMCAPFGLIDARKMESTLMIADRSEYIFVTYSKHTSEITDKSTAVLSKYMLRSQYRYRFQALQIQSEST